MSNNLQVYLGKLDVTNEIGETLDKQLQLAENTAQQFAGGSQALRHGAAKVGELGVHVDKDLEEGKLQFTTELEVAAYIKRYITRAGEVLLNLAEKSKNEELVHHGRVAAIRESMEIVKKHCTSAKARAEQIVAAQEEMAKMMAGGAPPAEAPVDRGARLPGQHPGPSSLADRRAERDAAKARAESPEPPTPEATPETSPETPVARQKRSYKKRQKSLPPEMPPPEETP